MWKEPGEKVSAATEKLDAAIQSFQDEMNKERLVLDLFTPPPLFLSPGSRLWSSSSLSNGPLGPL